MFRLGFWGSGSCSSVAIVVSSYLNLEHFDVEGDSKKGVKRVINNTTTAKNN
jgi:hypothetical protein